MYTRKNYKSKAAIKRDLAEGKKIEVFQPGGIFDMKPGPASCTLEGPHYPQPHRWYATATYDKDGYLTSIK